MHDRNERMFGAQRQLRPDLIDLLMPEAPDGWRCRACKNFAQRRNGSRDVHDYDPGCCYERLRGRCLRDDGTEDRQQREVLARTLGHIWRQRRLRMAGQDPDVLGQH